MNKPLSFCCLWDNKDLPLLGVWISSVFTIFPQSVCADDVTIELINSFPLFFVASFNDNLCLHSGCHLCKSLLRIPRLEDWVNGTNFAFKLIKEKADDVPNIIFKTSMK